MRILFAVLASVFLCLAAFADTVKTYQGHNVLPPNQCTFTISKADDGSVTGFLLKGPGELDMNFGVCAESTCQYSDMSADSMDPDLFKKLQYRVIPSNTFPQLTLDSRYVKEGSPMVFISRHLEIDMNDAGEPDEVRYTENTDFANMTMDQSRINCNHMQEITGSPTP